MRPKVTGVLRSRNRRICGLSSRLAKAPERKSRDIMGGGAPDREVGENLADHRRELVSVTGAWRSDDDVGCAGQAIDHEMAVRRHRVEARFGGDELTVCRRQMIGECRADQGLIFRGNASVVAVGVNSLVTVMMLGDLDTGVDRLAGWNPIVHAMPALDDENGQAGGRKRDRK